MRSSAAGEPRRCSASPKPPTDTSPDDPIDVLTAVAIFETAWRTVQFSPNENDAGPDLAAEQEALEEAITGNPMPIAYLVALAAEIAERAPQSAHEVLDEWRSRALRQIETGA